MELELWLINNLIDYEFILDKTLLIVSDKVFQVILSKEIEGEQKIFDEDFKLILDSNDINIIDEYKSDYFLFLFGGQWYYYQTNKSDPELNLFKYFGKAKQKRDLEYSFLGVHTGYELCNGSRLASDWVKKAKFLNIKNLGICELNTLAGSLKFQEECLKEKIKPIIGETIIVKTDSERYELKLFCKNEIGWKNLLNINAQINVFNDGYVTEQYLYEHNEGLIIVISCSKKLDERFLEFINCFVTDKEDVYFQIDTVQYSSNEKDKDHLLNIQNYLRRFSGKNLHPIFICDAYYLDQEDYKIKNLINKIGKVGFKYQSKDQYFKSIYDIEKQLRLLFIDDKDDGQQFIELFEQCLENTNKLANECNFQIDTDNFHLPRYIMTKEEERRCKNNEELLWYMIEKGFENKIEGKVENEDIYWERIQHEVSVIKNSDIIDYFLVLADIINWCNENDILVGVGRGSSAGSLVAYLINIVELDPIKYELLFERFLNEARLNNELPDIDTDFESKRRDDVKRYMEQRYGVDHVASIGTYGNFKIKSIIKDFGREMGLNFSDTNFITSIIDKDTENGEFVDLFKNSITEEKLKIFINNNPELINKINLVLWQPKTQSIHASATLVVPSKDINRENKKIYDWIPVKKVDGILITEWEGKQIESAGFLKEDILGTTQLDKFRMILDFIKKNHGKEINWTRDIPVDDEEVFKTLWHKGYTEDVFQFTTDGLKQYCRILKPDSLEELIAANALFRPGAMESNAHMDYVHIKFGKKTPEYDFLLKEVTSNTHGLYIYQEQIMLAFKVITDSTLQEADEFRKIITKSKGGVGIKALDLELYNKYKDLFINSYVKKGSIEITANKVWDKLVAFSKYGFNRSHAACYSYEAYVCNWFKYHYPLEFWITSLTYSKDEDIEKKIVEIESTEGITLMPPDINKSGKTYIYDQENQIIYWALDSISQMGEVKVNNIIEERDKNGDFYSFTTFIKRMDGKRIDKRAVVNLILCGCFDKIEKIINVIDRFQLLKKFCGDELPDRFSYENIIKEYFWLMEQKRLCGIGNVRFEKIYEKLVSKKEIVFPKKATLYSYEDLMDKKNLDNECIVVGVISDIRDFSTKKGKAGTIELNQNGKICYITCWSDFWATHEKDMKGSKGKILVMNGTIREFRGSNNVHANNYSVFKII